MAIIIKADSIQWFKQQQIDSKTCKEDLFMITTTVRLTAEANAILTLIIIR
jgi:hypothetical protein